MRLFSELLVWVLVIFVLSSSAMGMKNSDTAENFIHYPQNTSSLALGYFLEAKDYKQAETYSTKALAVTPYGGLKLFYGQTEGKQRLQPWERNIVTNGNKPRDFFNLERGRIRSTAFGYGFSHYVKNGYDYSLKTGYGEGRGYTFNDSTIPGHMEKTEYQLVFQAGMQNILNGLGLTAHGLYGHSRTFSRFYTGTSAEVLTLKQVGAASLLPLIPNRLYIEPSLLIEHERSDVINGDRAPGKILIDRTVTHQREEIGLGLKMYQNYSQKNYLKFNIILLLGEQRHEFETADLDGFRLKLEKGFGNAGDGTFLEASQKWYVTYEQRTSATYTEWPETDPATGLPIILEFSENRRYHKFITGYTVKDNYEFSIGYEEPVKTGSTVARSDILNLRIPMAKAKLEYKEVTIQGTKRFGTCGITAQFSHEFKYSNTEAGINLTYFF